MKKSKIRVLVVDDSALMRRTIQNLLLQDPDIDVIGFAKDGLEAISKAKELNPDVITLDIEMPNMDGMSCLESLQKQGTYGIIIVSSLEQEKASATIRALELGAFDFISKPTNIFDMAFQGKNAEIIDKVKLAFRTLKKADILKEQNKKVAVSNTDHNYKAPELKYIVAVGISTGGPRALTSILPQFPGDLPAALVIVQHMPPGFTQSLALRLNEMSELNVKEAEDNEEVRAGMAYIAPGDYHVTFVNDGSRLRIKLDKSPPIGGLRPNVDVMMASLAETATKPIIGVIMTGMGSDGSKGLKELKKKKKAFVIAQDESSSIVFGMPRSAIELGIVDKTVPLNEIPTSIMNFMGVRQ